MNNTKSTHEFTEGELERRAGGLEESGIRRFADDSHFSLRYSDQQVEESTNSKLRDLNMRIQGSQNSPTSGKANAKWCAKISTHVSINSNHNMH